MIIRRIGLGLALLLLVGCESPDAAHKQAEKRLLAETELLRSLHKDRETLVRDHRRRLLDCEESDQIEELRSGHRWDLASVDLEIGRQRDHIRLVKAHCDTFSD